MDYSEYLHFANEKLLQTALPILEKSSAELFEAKKNQTLEAKITLKQGKEVVTEGEQLAEQAMRELVEENYPTHSVIGEETGSTINDSEFAWVFDPIDGTSAFVQTLLQDPDTTYPENQNPCFGITIALVHNSIPVVSIVHDLAENITWACAKGHSATRNGQIVESPLPIKIAKGARLASTAPFDQEGNAIMFKTAGQQNAFAALQSAITGEDIAPRAISSKTITNRNCIGFMHLLEKDGVDIVWEGDLMYHDAAALVPILESAGIRITNEEGNALNFALTAVNQEFRIVAATEPLHSKVISYIAEHLTGLNPEASTHSAQNYAGETAAFGYASKFPTQKTE